MKVTLTSRALFGILFIIAALVGTPIAIYQLQQQQEIRQRADTTIAWSTSQSASTVCPTDGSGVNINATFNNTEPDKSYYAMNVVVTDKQTGKKVDLGSIRGGQSKSGVIKTGKATLAAGSVDFYLTWTDGHSGTDSRTASYKAIYNCNPPAPTPTTPYYPTVTPPKPTVTQPKPTITQPKPTVTRVPTTPYGPTPTICPSLGPVQNVKIDCPNCP